MLFPSPRYGAEALVKLLETVGATALLTSESPYPVQAEILERKSLQTHSVPSVEELFSRDEVERYPFSKTFAEHKHEPLICLRKFAVPMLCHIVFSLEIKTQKARKGTN